MVKRGAFPTLEFYDISSFFELSFPLVWTFFWTEGEFAYTTYGYDEEVFCYIQRWILAFWEHVGYGRDMDGPTLWDVMDDLGRK